MYLLLFATENDSTYCRLPWKGNVCTYCCFSMGRQCLYLLWFAMKKAMFVHLLWFAMKSQCLYLL